MAIQILNRARATGGLSFYDFGLGVLPAGTSFSRASAGWSFNSTGALVSAATDTPRFAYDPSTLTPRGLLIEPPVTNGLRNNTMVGAVAGTPGTKPTNWSAFTPPAGVTSSIVNAGTLNGIPYIDVRYQGTPTVSAAIGIQPETGTGIAAASGQKWLTSWYLAVIAGSGIATPRLNLSEFTAAGAFVTQQDMLLGSLSGTLTRYAGTGTLNGGATTAYVAPRFYTDVSTGVAIDFTLRIGAPDCSPVGNIAGPTSPILTTGVAATRASDVCLITDGSPLANNACIVKARTPVGTAQTYQVLLQIDDGTQNNRRLILRDSSNHIIVNTVYGGTLQTPLDAGAVANDTDFTLAVRFGDANFGASLNGGTVVKVTSGTNPAGLKVARVGTDAGGHEWGSTIRTIRTLPTASDADLPYLST